MIKTDHPGSSLTESSSLFKLLLFDHWHSNSVIPLNHTLQGSHVIKREYIPQCISHREFCYTMKDTVCCKSLHVKHTISFVAMNKYF